MQTENHGSTSSRKYPLDLVYVKVLYYEATHELHVYMYGQFIELIMKKGFETLYWYVL